MSILEQLDRLAPRDEKYLNLCRAHGPILAEAAERYMQHTSGKAPGTSPSSVAFLHSLASKLMLREEVAIGALIRAQQIDDKAEAALYSRQAKKNAQLALVFAFAMKKAISTDSDLQEKTDIQGFATRIASNLLSRFDGGEPARRLYDTLSTAEQRGWATISPTAALPIINGANWCPDTANLAEIANALSVPIAIIFFDYIQPPEDKGRRKHGIFQIQDHAQAVYQDGFDSPNIPVVRYPNGVTHFEPPIHEYVAQLAENKLI